MSDVWESAGLVTEVWESNTTPGVEWRVIIRDGDIVVSDEQIAAAIVAYFDGSTPVLEGDGAGGALSGTYPSPGLNTEAVQDLVGAMAGAGLTYDDETGLIDADPPGVPDHNDTTNRDAVDAHPISSITGLQAALDAAGGGGADLSDATPQDLGTAAAGVSTEASRADHVHDMPTAADIAVDASGFNGNLTTSDDTVQEIAQKLDDLVIPAAGIADPGGANDDFLQRKSGAWTNRTIAQVQADLGVSSHVARTQAYLAPGVLSTTGASGVLAMKDYEVYIPFFIPAGTYDAIGVRTTAAGTATWELALYTADASVRPTSRITSFGSLDMSVSAGRLLITGIGLTVTTSAWYFVGVKATAYTSNPTFWRMATNHWPNGLQGWPIRDDAAEGFSHLHKTTGLAAGPLPATAPAVGTGTGELNYSQACPRILLRKA